MSALQVRMLAPRGSKPELVCVLCHGYGAPGDDLVPIGASVLRDLGAQAAERVAFAFPEAPLDLGYGGRAWWHIDIARLQSAIMVGDVEPLFDDVPDGLADARKKLRETIDEIAVQTSLPMSRVVLGGFSQGAMLTTDLALRLEEAPAALAILSGALVARPEWTKLAQKRAGLHVLQSHGTADPILPFAGAVALRAMLEAAGLVVDFVSFPGGHGVPANAVQKLGALIASRWEPR